MEDHVASLAALPQQDGDIWQGAWVRLPYRMEERGGPPRRRYVPMWISLGQGLVHLGDVVPSEQHGAFAPLVATLSDFACGHIEPPHRPTAIEVSDPALGEHLSGLLAPVGIAVRVVERLQAVEATTADLVSRAVGDQLPGALSGRDVTVEQLRRFAEAAAAFYRAAPWQYLGEADVIHVEAPAPPKSMSRLTVLGAGDMSHGLGFYASLSDWLAFRRAATGEGPMPDSGYWHVCFDNIAELPVADADLWDDYELPVAGPNAHPLLWKVGGRQVRRADAPRLAFVEGLLWALAGSSEAEMDSGRWRAEVETAAGPMQFTLAIPDLLDPPSHGEWMARGFMPDRRFTDRFSAVLDRYLRNHPVESEEELREVLDTHFIGRPLDGTLAPAETPLERAQDLCFEAFSCHGRRQVLLARQALQISPDCADAHVLLAEHSATPAAALEFYAAGMAAGERTLGPQFFEENAGNFWGISSTRPYMRARFGLAQALEALDREAEAAGHYRELLRLNPNDNLGVRYVLLPLLMQLNADEEAARLLKSYDQESSANWAYARALLAFRLGGRTAAVQRELRAALQVNPHVPAVLVDAEPQIMPESYGPGTVEEAIVCADELRPAFLATPGALDWLAAEHRQRERKFEAHRRHERRKQREQRKNKKRNRR
jgi:tetratricopeptide (TPR) repeat protein